MTNKMHLHASKVASYFCCSLLAGINLIWLSACSQKNPHANLQYPSKTRSGVSYVATTPPINPIAWWQQLHDRQLDDLIQHALANNQSIQSAKATITVAQAQLKAAQYAWLPTLNASGNVFIAQSFQPAIDAQGLFQQPKNRRFSNITKIKLNNYFGGFLPTYSVNILNDVYNIRSAKASLAIQQANLLAGQLSVISQVAGTYFMLISQRQQLQLETELVNTLKTMRNLDRAQYRIGTSSLEAVENDAQLLAAEAAKLPDIASVVAQSENTLHLLCNENPAALRTQRRIQSLDTTVLMPKRLSSAVLRNRPDIMIAYHQVQISQAQLGISYSVFFPTFKLDTALEGASFSLANILKLNATFWAAKLSTPMTLLNASAFANVQAAKANILVTYGNYLQTLRQAFSEVDTGLTHQKNSQLSYQHSHEASLAAQHLYQLARSKYQTGYKDYRTVIDAKINWLLARLQEVQAKAQLLDDAVLVYQAIAAGDE